MNLGKVTPFVALFKPYWKILAIVSVLNLAAIGMAISGYQAGQWIIGVALAWVITDGGVIWIMVRVVRPLMVNRDEWKQHAQGALETTKDLRSELDAAITESDNWRAAYERERTS